MNEIKLTIEKNLRIKDGLYRLTLISGEALPPFAPMQFVNLEIPGRRDLILRRPFCIYRASGKTLTLVYAVVGAGTKSLSEARVGETVSALYPLGNGITLPERFKSVALIGGGLGVAPLLSVAERHKDRKVRAYLGFKDKAEADAFTADFAAVCKTKFCTLDGSFGIKGFPTDAFTADGDAPDVIVTCGPHGLLRAVRELTQKAGIPAYASTEERMGCGMGACLVCACEVIDGGKTVNKRACYDGPVFDLKDLVL